MGQREWSRQLPLLFPCVELRIEQVIIYNPKPDWSLPKKGFRLSRFNAYEILCAVSLFVSIIIMLLWAPRTIEGIVTDISDGLETDVGFTKMITLTIIAQSITLVSIICAAALNAIRIFSIKGLNSILTGGIHVGAMLFIVLELFLWNTFGYFSPPPLSYGSALFLLTYFNAQFRWLKLFERTRPI